MSDLLGKIVIAETLTTQEGAFFDTGRLSKIV